MEVLRLKTADTVMFGFRTDSAVAVLTTVVTTAVRLDSRNYHGMGARLEQNCTVLVITPAKRLLLLGFIQIIFIL